MATKILECTCRHDYQDILYGKRKRAHTYSDSDKTNSDSDKTKKWRCTVCRAEQDGPAPVEK